MKKVRHALIDLRTVCIPVNVSIGCVVLLRPKNRTEVDTFRKINRYSHCDVIVLGSNE